MAQLPNVKLNVHPSMFDLMMAVLERNTAAEDVPTRNSAQDLMNNIHHRAEEIVLHDLVYTYYKEKTILDGIASAVPSFFDCHL